MDGLQFTNRVQVEVVECPALIGSWVDEPASGSRSHDPYLHIRGWAAGIETRVTHVVVRTTNPLARIPVDIPRPDVAQAYHRLSWNKVVGFDFRFGLIGLPRHAELLLQAEMADRDRLAIARVTVDREVRHDQVPSLINPLMLTSRGRSGSTRMMHLLAEHPAIVAVNRYPCEVHVGAFSLLNLRMLTATYERHFGTGLVRPVPRTFLDGSVLDPGDGRIDPSLVAPNVDDDVRPAFESTLYGGIVESSRRMATDFYSRIARRSGGPPPVYFAEKFPLSKIGGWWYQDVARDVYPRAKEVILVRDMRDMICSALSFSKRRGQAMFAREAAVSDEDYVRTLGQLADAEMVRWKQLGDSAMIVRYEDLVLDPAATLRRVFAYLEIDDSPETIQAAIERAARHAESLDKHRTTASPEASIGRWRRDLSPDLQALSRELFAAFLGELGYPLD